MIVAIMEGEWRKETIIYEVINFIDSIDQLLYTLRILFLSRMSGGINILSSLSHNLDIIYCGY